MTRVQLEQGVLEGNQEDGVFRFAGLPYAAPPVGDLRWAAPRPPAAWAGVRDATNFGNAAIQTANDPRAELGAPQSEDCLYLNVWSTSLDPRARRPVMVWIHGGGFLGGAGSMMDYHGAALARRGVTSVSFNYRLGAFGFLDHPRAGGNFAVQDWVAALNWVARNILAFGGDPDNVTVFGQSAGATAGRTLLATPSAQGLFHRVILQSAGFEPAAALPDTARERLTEASARLSELLGGGDLERLRQAPVEQVRQASFQLSGTIPSPGQVHTPANLVWCPAEDGAVVGTDLSCWPADIPVLFGHTADEARYFITPTGPFGAPPGTVDPAQLYTPATLARMATVLSGQSAERIVGSLTGSPYEQLAELFTTAIWTEPALASYRRFAELGRRAYAYRFRRVSPGNRRTGKLAFHCSEIPYVFGRLAPAEAYDEVDAQVSDTVAHAWTEFARTGVPSSPDGARWPAATTAAPQVTVVDDRARTGPLDVSPVTELINSLR
ncbi:carboxylesterase/lipase family protein [Amycolatopsis saalfeldensis]|uniref:Carboxylic ester hydrolase n=1 Tax=Amycolatopsis saalfeldensis TaxID=394193 RepID=A0A1H8Y4S3_9PSEU|nr:carboxylesterase family protein [Amycolatopsis saalfeldensis]SEP46993.1 para-nitrobenzyl esterase [Amycolatopsis saalfeldensis]